MTLLRTVPAFIVTFCLYEAILVDGNHRKSSTTSRIPEEELDPEFWNKKGREELEMAINRRINEGTAKNTIIFLGDGMGVSTVTAARIFKGQQEGHPGEETELVFERFPNMGFSKTYNVDHQVADSAATATAFLCGVKANYGTLGVDPRVSRGHCGSSNKDKNLTCILELSQRAGKATGFVTTSTVTHATPAPLYAYSPDRTWENDSQLKHLNHHQRRHCTDIGSQLMGHVGKDINVVMGGGRKHLMPVYAQDPEYEHLYGQRDDGRDLIDEWIKDKILQGKHAEFAWDQAGFDAVDPSKTDHLLGLFEHGHMRFSADRENDRGGEPSLAEMVKKTIPILSKNKNGFFLLVEGARIDHAHHGNTARVALEEVVAMEEAVKAALSLVDADETLMIVTADHSHPLNIGSYATRGNPILGLSDYSDDYSKTGLSDVDNLPYTTLSYANGPGYDMSRPRRNLINVDTQSHLYRQATSVPTRIVSHDGTDVAIYASGPMAHLFHRTHEQHYIFHVMAYAASLGEHQHRLHQQQQQQPSSHHRYGPRYEESPSIRVASLEAEGFPAGRVQENPSAVVHHRESSGSSHIHLSPATVLVTLACCVLSSLIPQIHTVDPL